MISTTSSIESNSNSIDLVSVPPALPIFAEDIYQALSILRNDTDPIELRIITPNAGRGNSKISFCYYTDRRKLAEHAASLAVGDCYYTINPIKQSKLTADNTIQINTAKTGDCAKDCDIARRKYLVLDFDPNRPTNVCATTEEKQHAVNLADRVARDLTEEYGFSCCNRCR